MTTAMLMAAPNGARKTKADHPALPITPDEIAAEARACLDAGATAFHLHARDGNGAHTLDPAIYQQYIDAVTQSVGDNMVLQITTEAVGRYRPDEQMASVRALRPAAVSLAVREIIPDAASEETAEAFLREIAEWGCSPQYILYDAADAFRFAELIGHGVIPQEHPHAIFVLGRYLKPGEETKPGVLSEFLCDWPESWPWTVCAFGAAETRALAAAVALGGHARIGFENNTLNADGMVAQSNAERVFNLRHAIESFGVRPMDIGETRRLFEASAAV